VLNDTWYSRDLPVLTAIAEKLERGGTSSAREAVGLWPSSEARQATQRRPGHDEE
jgi:hypothetical protein